MAKAIREFSGKQLLHKYMDKLKCENGLTTHGELVIPFMSAPVDEGTDFDLLVTNNQWLKTEVSQNPLLRLYTEGGRGNLVVCHAL